MSTSWSTTAKLALIAARYRAGTILLSTAAKQAKLTPIEFMEYLSAIGHVSPYSIKDFDEGQAMLDEYLGYKPPRKAKAKVSRTNPCP